MKFPMYFPTIFHVVRKRVPQEGSLIIEGLITIKFFIKFTKDKRHRVNKGVAEDSTMIRGRGKM